MTATATIGLLGCGFQVPTKVRRNDDPIFAGLDTSRNAQGIYQSVMFRGLDRRYVLEPDESITPLVTESCRQALDRAGLAPADVDRLYGYVTVPTYLAPNPLYEIHHELGLPEESLVVPINCEYTNFIAGLILAEEYVSAGTARHCLVACGNNWTKHLDYTQGHATGIGDAAAAAVVGPSDRYVIVDHATATHGNYYHSMNMVTQPLMVHGRPYVPIDPSSGLPSPTLMISQTGLEVIGSVFKDGVPTMAETILERNGITSESISLITHQGIRPLMDDWTERIHPKKYLDTLDMFGNMITCTYPVNLAHAFDQVDTEYVLMVGVGNGVHISAVLLRV